MDPYFSLLNNCGKQLFFKPWTSSYMINQPRIGAKQLTLTSNICLLQIYHTLLNYSCSTPKRLGVIDWGASTLSSTVSCLSANFEWFLCGLLWLTEISMSIIRAGFVQVLPQVRIERKNDFSSSKRTSLSMLLHTYSYLSGCVSCKYCLSRVNVGVTAFT